MTLAPRCGLCQRRHTEADPYCPDPGEEGFITRPMLIDAFRTGACVCLGCQSIWTSDAMPDGFCPCCGEPRERFAEDDLEEAV